jgi:hypothetical protein
MALLFQYYVILSSSISPPLGPVWRTEPLCPTLQRLTVLKEPFLGDTNFS